LGGAAGFRSGDGSAKAHQSEDPAVLHDLAANGSRLGGRFAPLAGMTQEQESSCAIAVSLAREGCRQADEARRGRSEKIRCG
jgi:hypothetical protein